MEKYRNALSLECENRIYEIPEFTEGDFFLDPHQTDAMVETYEALVRGEDAFSIVHSCGSGKTIVEANMLLASSKVKQQLGMNNHTDLLLTTERALIHSIYEELKSFDMDLGIWAAGKKVLDRPTVLTTIQTLQVNRDKLHKMFPLEKIPLVLGDEADKQITGQRKAVIQKFKNALDRKSVV